MEQQFTLSKSNKIYYGIAAIALIGVSIVVGDISSVTIVRFMGKLLGLLFLSSLFAWIVWRLSGKNERRKSLTFNIVLTLALLGQLAQTAQKAQQYQQLNELGMHAQKFKETVYKDPEAYNSAYNKFMDSSKTQFDSLSKTGTGSEKQFFKIMGEFMSEVQVAYQDWSNSFAAIQAPEILDYALLNNDEVFENQKKIIQLYLDKTKNYQVFHKGVLPDLEERLSVFGKDNTLAKDALEGFTDKYLAQKPTVELLLQAHLDYGNGLLQMLEFLRKNQGKWVYANSELTFNTDDMINQYNELVKDVVKQESIVNTLSQNLIKNI